MKLVFFLWQVSMADEKHKRHDPLLLWEDHEACWKMQYRGSLGQTQSIRFHNDLFFNNLYISCRRVSSSHSDHMRHSGPHKNCSDPSQVLPQDGH